MMRRGRSVPWRRRWILLRARACDQQTSGAVSIPQLQIGRHLNAASRIGIIPPADRNPARTWLAAAEDRQRWHREGFHALTLPRVVELRHLGRDDPGEIPVDPPEPRPQRSDILELVCGGWPIPGRNRSVKLIGRVA